MVGRHVWRYEAEVGASGHGWGWEVGLRQWAATWASLKTSCKQVVVLRTNASYSSLQEAIVLGQAAVRAPSSPDQARIESVTNTKVTIKLSFEKKLLWASFLQTPASQSAE